MKTGRLKKAPTKLGLEIDKELYDALSKLAEKNGQSRRFLLEQALRLYFEVTAPSQAAVRPGVLAHYRKSAEKNRELLRLLAQ